MAKKTRGKGNKKKGAEELVETVMGDRTKSASESDIEDLHHYLFTDEEKKNLSQMRNLLLDWYDEKKRDLPWRRKRERSTMKKEQQQDNTQEANIDKKQQQQLAYQVWVSEIMLQQTRVDTVIDYFNKWMNKFPTIQSLSEASLEDVNKVWAGLGYYRRAKFLHEAAKIIVSRSPPEIPSSVNELLKLPGIGRYTAGAISSIVFDKVEPIVDGNIIRVITRLRKIEEETTNTKVMNHLIWPLADQLVQTTCRNQASEEGSQKNYARPGDFNQALMELGACICTPKNPKCNQCPVSSYCKAYTTQGTDVERYPVKKAKKEPKPQTVVSCVFIKVGEESKKKNEKQKIKQTPYDYLLIKRPETGLLADLWEFPSVIIPEENSSDHKGSLTLLKKKCIENELILSQLKPFINNQIVKGKEITNNYNQNKCDGNNGDDCKDDDDDDEIDNNNETIQDKNETLLDCFDFIYCGQTTHIFTHIKQSIHVYKVHLPKIDPNVLPAPSEIEIIENEPAIDTQEDEPIKDKKSGENRCCWMSKSVFNKSAVPTAQKVVFRQYESHLKVQKSPFSEFVTRKDEHVAKSGSSNSSKEEKKTPQRKRRLSATSLNDRNDKSSPEKKPQRPKRQRTVTSFFQKK